MLQSAPDAAALSAARQCNYTSADRQEMAQAHLSSNGMNEQDGVTPQIDVHGQTVDFQVTMSVPKTFARIAGQESFQVEAHARALASNDTTDYEAIDCST